MVYGTDFMVKALLDVITVIRRSPNIPMTLFIARPPKLSRYSLEPLFTGAFG
jgi:heptaprenylglyceryl phosphate synthase